MICDPGGSTEAVSSQKALVKMIVAHIAFGHGADAGVGGDLDISAHHNTGDMVGNQLLDKTEWTVDTYSVTGSGGSEKTYSVPGSKAYVMIPDEEDVAEAAKLIEGVLNETER